MTLRHLLPLAGLLLGFAAAAPLPAHAAADTGDLWEDTIEMNLPGFPARPQVHKRCSARGVDAVPMADKDKHCTLSDVRRSGGTMAWKMSCAGNPPTTASAEMVYEGTERYRGTMTMNADGRTMTMKMSGKRIGECDAGEARRQLAATRQKVAATQQQAADAMAATCKGAVDAMMPQMLGTDAGYGCGAAHQAEFCKKLQSPAGFSTVAARRPTGIAGLASGDLTESGAFCGVDGEQLRVKFCRSAEQNESLDFLAGSCLGAGYGKAIAARECAGRSFSSPPAERYRSFCSAVVREGMMQPAGRTQRAAVPVPASETTPAATPAPTPATPQAQAVEAGKQLLKGLFGR
jgi:hypothetical protein